MHYYKHNIGDYARDTSHLTIVEHGIYRLLLDWCYLNESSITTEKAMRVGRGYPTETQSVLNEFFVGSEGVWTHKRVAEEVEKYRANAAKNRQNGGSGGRPKSKNNPLGSDSVANGNQMVTLTNNQEPITNKEQEQSSSLRSDDSGQPNADLADPCPHQEIIAAYHAALPMLPQVREWTAERQKLMRARWREKPERQSVKWWADFFAYVAESDFLTGRAGDFMADLEWLIRPKNFVKVYEGRYENRGAL